MRCLLAKLNDYLREHSVSVGYIDADPPRISARSATAVRSTVLPVPRAPTKIVALLVARRVVQSPQGCP